VQPGSQVRKVSTREVNETGSLDERSNDNRISRLCD